MGVIVVSIGRLARRFLVTVLMLLLLKLLFNIGNLFKEVTAVVATGGDIFEGISTTLEGSVDGLLNTALVAVLASNATDASL